MASSSNDQGASAVVTDGGDSQHAILSTISAIEKKAGITDAKSEQTLKKTITKELKRIDQEVGGKPMDEAMSLMKDKYIQMYAQTKRDERTSLQLKTEIAELSKWKSLTESETSKTASARAKLEALCRELQKQNRAVQEDSRRNEELQLKKREELSNQFQTTIDDISSRLEADRNEKSKKAEEHDELRSSLQKFMSQNDIRLQHFEKLLESKDLELQLANAKFEQQQQVAAHEATRASTFKLEYEKLKLIEAELKSQLAMYSDKFSSFQETLTKSADVFTKHQKDMEQMSKTISKVNKEKNMWHARWEKINAINVVAVDQKTKQEALYLAAQTKMVTLEKLCRALRAAAPTTPRDTEPKKQQTTNEQTTITINNVQFPLGGSSPRARDEDTT